jgi:hypothetical protein
VVLAGFTVVLSGAADAKIVSLVAPERSSNSFVCDDTYAMDGVIHEALLETSNLTLAPSGMAYNHETGNPFEDADLYHRAQQTIPPGVWRSARGYDRERFESAGFRAQIQRIYEATGDPPSWQERSS